MNTFNHSSAAIVYSPFAERKTVQEAKTSDSISEHIEKLSKLECAIEKNAIRAMRFYG